MKQREIFLFFSVHPIIRAENELPLFSVKRSVYRCSMNSMRNYTLPAVLGILTAAGSVITVKKLAK